MAITTTDIHFPAGTSGAQSGFIIPCAHTGQRTWEMGYGTWQMAYGMHMWRNWGICGQWAESANCWVSSGVGCDFCL